MIGKRPLVHLTRTVRFCEQLAFLNSCRWHWVGKRGRRKRRDEETGEEGVCTHERVCQSTKGGCTFPECIIIALEAATRMPLNQSRSLGLGLQLHILSPSPSLFFHSPTLLSSLPFYPHIHRSSKIYEQSQYLRGNSGLAVITARSATWRFRVENKWKMIGATWKKN